MLTLLQTPDITSWSSPRGPYIILVYIIFCECSETYKLVQHINVCTTLRKTYVCMLMYFVPCRQLLLYVLHTLLKSLYDYRFSPCGWLRQFFYFYRYGPYAYHFTQCRIHDDMMMKPYLLVTQRQHKQAHANVNLYQCQQYKNSCTNSGSLRLFM